jgi:hypothetical protein
MSAQFERHVEGATTVLNHSLALYQYLYSLEDCPECTNMELFASAVYTIMSCGLLPQCGDFVLFDVFHVQPRLAEPSDTRVRTSLDIWACFNTGIRDAMLIKSTSALPILSKKTKCDLWREITGANISKDATTDTSISTPTQQFT